MNRVSYLICWALAILVAVAALPFGSVHTVPLAILQGCLLALALVWMTSRLRQGLSPIPWTDPILLGGAALFGLGLVQIAPLPMGLVETLSPHAAAMKAQFSPGPITWTSLSMDPYATWQSCLLIACWTLAALMVRHSAVDFKGRLIVAGGIVAGGVFQAGYGLYEFISGRQHIFAYQKEWFTDVATGTFISRNNYAGYLEMTIPLALALAVLGLGRRRRSGPDMTTLKQRLAAATGQESFRALALMMGAFLMLTALLMSRSRMAIISIAFALLVGGLALGLKGRSRRFAVASVAVAAVVGVFASQIDILPVLQRFRHLEGEVWGSGYGRRAVWTQALPMVRDYAFFGSGLGTYEAAFSPYRDDSAQVRVDFAHNDYLEFTSEAGAAGIVMLGLGALLALRHRRRWRSAGGHQDEISVAAGAGLVAIALHSFTDFHLSIPADALMVAVLLGLLLRKIGPAAAPALQGGVQRSGRLDARPAWAVCAIVLAGLALSAATPAVARMRSAPASADPAALDDLDAGGIDLDAAAPDELICPDCRLEPFNASRYIEAAAGARRRLLKDVEALLRIQAGGQLPAVRTRQYLARRLDDAIRVAEDGLRLSPLSAKGHLETGLLHFGRFALTGLPPQASEDFRQAMQSFEKALVLQPWRAASFRRVARLGAPFWADCDPQQRRFIEQAVRRARELDPSSGDIQESFERMGL